MDSVNFKELKSEMNEYIKSETKNLLKASKESDDDPVDIRERRKSFIKTKAEILLIFRELIKD